jgi:N-acetylglutamate synthase
MPQEIITREFRITDYDAAVRLWTNVEGIEIAEGDSNEEIARFLSQNPDLSRVAEEGGNVVGAALCGHDGRRGYIYHLAVEPGYQQKGLARKLVGECLDRLRHHGLKRVLILVAADNPGGRAFWIRCGWEEVLGALVMGIDL